MKTALQWIERSRMGDRDAFARIVEQYQGMVSAVTFHVAGDFAQSEDLAQETFLTVWKKLPELREPEKLASWIYGIARRTALHWQEKQQHNPLRGAAEVDDETAVDPRREREQIRHKQEQSLELVWSTVKELPENLREPLLLYYRYSKSASDIAATMDVTEDVVYQRLSRGRKLLKVEVEKQVESVLEATRPDAAFTLAVLASLPLAAMAGDAALAAATGTTATAVGTGGATTGKTAGLAAFWAVIGPIAYFLWMFSLAFITQWIQVRNAPTLNARRYRLYSVYFMSRYFMVLCCGMGLVTGGISLFLAMFASIYDFYYPRPLPVFLSMVVAVPLTVTITQRSHKQYKNIIETDLGIAETPAKFYSNADVARCIDSALFVNLLVIETLLGIVLFLSLPDGSGGVIYSLVAAGIAALAGLLFYGHSRFGLWLLETCCVESSLRDQPPFIDKAFESALGRTGVNPASPDDVVASKRQPAWMKFWLWGGAALMTAWYVSFLDWATQPIPTALCLAGLFAGLITPIIWVKRYEKLPDRALIFGLFAFANAFFIMALLSVQCGGLSPALVWQKATTFGSNGIYLVLMILCILAIFAGINNLIRYWWRKRPEKRRRDEEYDERIREALARYQPVETHDATRLEIMPFPKRWIWIIGLYAAAIVVMGCLGVLINGL